MPGTGKAGVSSRPSVRVETITLAAAGVGLAVYAASTIWRPEGSYQRWADVWLYLALQSAAAGLCLNRAIRDRTHRVAWAAIGAGIAAAAVGDLAYVIVVSRQPDPPYPSIADVFYLAFFPAVYVGVVMLLRGTVSRFLPSMWFDAVVGALSAAAAGYLLVFGDLLDVSGGRAAEVMTNLAYPLGDLLLLVFAAAAVAALGWQCGREWWLLLAGLITVAVADTVYAVAVNAGTYVDGGPLDILWPLSSLLVATAATCRPTGATRGRTQAWWSQLLVPGIFAACSVLLLATAQGPGPGSDLAAAAILVAIGRVGLTFREVSGMTETRRQARTDELTGLTNRRAFHLRLGRALDQRAAHERLAVLLIDLDRFKEVNDALGHHVGDDLLRLVGPRLAGCLRPQDLLARIGGDEFAILLREQADEAAARAVAQRVTDALVEPFELPEISLHVGASIGIALCPQHAVDPATLLQQADVAMYDAKSEGGGYQLYDPAHDLHSRDRLITIEQLRVAIASDHLVLHYQPKIDLAGGGAVGVEALVRWEHPDRGLLAPAQFLPLAEQAGLMRSLTLWVLDAAMAQAGIWFRRGLELPVAVNVSASNLLDAALPTHVAELLEKHEIPPRCLGIEVTESTMMADPVRAQQVVESLHQLGVSVSVDDYGTGHSSLAYLRDLHVSELKLDREFIRHIVGDLRTAAIVRTTVDLAHSLGLRLIAEGVEDEQVADILTGFGCDIAQGFHYSRPVEASALDDWLGQRLTPAEA